MRGEDLYNLYAETKAKQNIGINGWEGLDDDERAAWIAVAARVRYRT